MKSVFRFVAFPVVALCAACTGTQGEFLWGRPESSGWFESAAPQTVASHFSQRCAAYGYKPGSDELADCIRQEVESARARNAAVEAAIATRPHVTVVCEGGWPYRRHHRWHPSYDWTWSDCF